MRFLVDTHLLVYAVNSSCPEHGVGEIMTADTDFRKVAILAPI
jgi:predicted nucleic acid-binding protein